MSEKVKLSKDGSSIDFVQSESIPTSLKKFRQSPEIEGFYRFIFENDLQKEAFEILERIIMGRKAKKAAEKAAIKEATKAAKVAEKVQAKQEAAKPKILVKDAPKAVKPELKKAAPAPAAPAPKALKLAPKPAPKQAASAKTAIKTAQAGGKAAKMKATPPAKKAKSKR